MVSALPGTRLVVLPPGPVPSAHSPGGAGTNTGVASGPYDRALTTAEAFLANATRSWHPAGAGALSGSMDISAA